MGGKRTFIQDQHLAPPHHRSRQRQDLPLTHRQVPASARDRAVQGQACLVVLVLQREQPGGFEGGIEYGVVVFVEGVEVLTEGATEEFGLCGKVSGGMRNGERKTTYDLGDDGYAGTQSIQVERVCGNAVEYDSSFRQYAAQQRQRQRTLYSQMQPDQ